MADKRITVDVRRNPTGSIQLLDAAHNTLASDNRVFPITRGSTFYLRVNGGDLDGDAVRYYSRIALPDGTLMNCVDEPRDSGDGYNGSRTFGPFTANVECDWEVWSHVSDATARGWGSVSPWNENANGWYSSPHYTLRVYAVPESVTLTLGGASIEYGQGVTVASTITASKGNLQWHGIWATAPGAASDHAKDAAWINKTASGNISTIAGTFLPASAGTWRFFANGHDTDSHWGPGSAATLAVGKTTPRIIDAVSKILLSTTPLSATTHLAAHAVNPHNQDTAAPSVTYTIIAGGKGSAPNGTVLAPPRVLPSGTYTVRISTPETGNYNAAAQNVIFKVTDNMTAEEQLHAILGFDTDAATSTDNGQLGTELYTPAR